MKCLLTFVRSFLFLSALQRHYYVYGGHMKENLERLVILVFSVLMSLAMVAGIAVLIDNIRKLFA